MLRFLARPFCAAADPYFILGLSRGADFQLVKQTFLKLAAEYHPDINPDPAATRHFLLVKEAYELVKHERGLSRPQDLQQSSDEHFQSIRPDAQQYTAAGAADGSDPFVNYARTPSGAEYQKFKSSFQTIHGFKDSRIKVKDVKLKDTDSRFGLEKLRARISTLRKDSKTYFALLVVFLVLTTILLGKQVSQYFLKQELSGFARMLQKEAVVKYVSQPDIGANVRKANVPTLKGGQQQLRQKQLEERVEAKLGGLDYVKVTSPEGLLQ